MEPNDSLLDCLDEELLAHFRQGRREAFGVLLRRYERELYGYLRRYLGDEHLADDVFQNTFLQVYTRIGTYEPGRPVRPWLYTIATHQAIDALRRAGRQQILSLDQQREELVDGELSNLVSLLEHRGPGPLQQAQEEERRQAVHQAVDQLPEVLRQVVLLAYFQGLKYRDVADILQIPVGTVKSRLHTALLKLQENWSESTALRE